MLAKSYKFLSFSGFSHNPHWWLGFLLCSLISFFFFFFFTPLYIVPISSQGSTLSPPLSPDRKKKQIKGSWGRSELHCFACWWNWLVWWMSLANVFSSAWSCAVLFYPPAPQDWTPALLEVTGGSGCSLLESLCCRKLITVHEASTYDS